MGNKPVIGDPGGQGLGLTSRKIFTCSQISNIVFRNGEPIVQELVNERHDLSALFRTAERISLLHAALTVPTCTVQRITAKTRLSKGLGGPRSCTAQLSTAYDHRFKA